MEMICFGNFFRKMNYVLIIYDISSNARRQKVAKLLEGYGKR